MHGINTRAKSDLEVQKENNNILIRDLNKKSQD